VSFLAVNLNANNLLSETPDVSRVAFGLLSLEAKTAPAARIVKAGHTKAVSLTLAEVNESVVSNATAETLNVPAAIASLKSAFNSIVTGAAVVTVAFKPSKE